MLDALRRGARTWAAKLLMILLIASFGVWGISGYHFTGSTAVAEVGGTEIDAPTFQRAYTRQIQAMSRQMGQPVDPEFAQAVGLPQQVLNQLLAEATLTEEARDLGLGISDEALAKEITEDPTLRPPGSNQFDRGYLVRLLRENGLSEAAYVADRRLASLRGQLTDSIVGGLAAPEAYVALFDRYRSETRAIDYAVLSTAAAGPAPTPTDDDVKAYYEAHIDDYQAPEYRKISVISATPETLADPAGVSDEDARKEYERTKTSYTTPEQRRVRQLLFPTIEEARAASDKIKAGATFDQIVAERGQAPADVELGLVSRDKIVDPAIAEAAFTAQPNAVSDPIEARFGGALVQVTEVVPEGVQPFEAVSAEIKTALATREAERTVLETHDEIEDARAGGATLKEIADRFKLKLLTLEVDENGRDRQGNPIPAIPAQADVLRAAFAAAEGDENDPVSAGRGFVWYAVDGVTASQDRPLEEVRDAVVAAWTEEKVDEALANKAREMADAVRSGGDFAALATAAGSKVEKAEGLSRGGNPPEALGPAVVEGAFGGPVGYVGSAAGNGPEQVVFKVTDVTVPPFFMEEAETKQVAGQLAGQLGQGLLALYIDETQKALGATVNEQAVQSVVGAAR